MEDPVGGGQYDHALRAKSRLSGPSRHPDWRFVESDTVRGIGARNLYVSYEPLHGKDPRAAQLISPPSRSAGHDENLPISSRSTTASMNRTGFSGPT